MHNESATDRAIEYALGLLDDAARREFETRLATDPSLRSDASAFATVLSEVLRMSEPVPPPTDLKSRLMNVIRAERVAQGPQHWKNWPADPADDRVLVRGRQGAWEATDIDGIEVRRLAVDERADRVTMMIRMAPGTRYPRHRHGGVEECYVLDGDLRHGAHVMRAGDYEWCATDSVHEVQWTEGGCTLLVSSSRADERLSPT